MKTFKTFGVLVLVVFFFSCQSQVKEKDALPSWNQTEIKQQIVDYMKVVNEKIPVEDRVAVFDMDGTISCETPLWPEMAVMVQGLMDQLAKDSTLIQQTAYQYAKKLYENPADTTVLNHLVVNGVNYQDSITMKAFYNVDHEAYVDYARKYLTSTKAPKYNLTYSEQFYQPMLELLELLKANQFQIYIVSGSTEGIIWSICPQTIGLDRSHLIGTRQMMTPVYNKGGEASFVLQKGIFPPKNDGNGKGLNIYSAIGKIPVLAFGNTTGDFGMFHLASTSKYPHMALMLNHDDAAREYAYEPYHGTAVHGWQDSLRVNGWLQVDMSKEFNTVWKTSTK